MANTQNIKIALIDPNDGQIPNLPANPRTNDVAEFGKIKKSIKETPEMLELRALIVYPLNGRYVTIGGNLRLRAMKALGYKEAPCFVLPADTDADKLKKYTLIDNGSFGKWDWDKLANEWDDLTLTDYNLPVWNTPSAEVVTGQQVAPTYAPVAPSFPAPPAGDAAPQIYQPNLNPVDGEKPITDAEVQQTAQQLATAFSGQVQQMQEVICPCCGHKFYIKG